MSHAPLSVPREQVTLYRLGARTRFVVERQRRECLPVDEAA